MRLFTAVSVSALFLAIFAPAVSAQNNRDTNVIIVECSQVQQIFSSQGQYASAGAIGDGAVAEIAQELNISQSQVNACLGSIGGGTTNEEATNEKTTGGETTGGDTTNGEKTEETTVVDGETVIIDPAVGASKLPETGGASFGGIVLASGCALLGAGLILGRVAR